MESVFLTKDTAFAASEFQKLMQSTDWNDYKNLLYNNKSKYYARFLLRGSKNWHHLAFSNELVNYSNNRKKEDFQVLDKNCSVRESKDYF